MSRMIAWTKWSPIPGRPGAIHRELVTPRHISRETLNRPPRATVQIGPGVYSGDALARSIIRRLSKERRRARMRLRKLRGWR
jgi:hypothetical protein